MVMSPSVGLYTPVSMLKIVVLPAPFGPISPTSSPGWIAKLNSDTAVRPPKRMVTLRASRSGASEFVITGSAERRRL